jgi:hypothetical protein
MEPLPRIEQSTTRHRGPSSGGWNLGSFFRGLNLNLGSFGNFRALKVAAVFFQRQGFAALGGDSAGRDTKIDRYSIVNEPGSAE